MFVRVAYIVGHTASGKSTLGRYLADTLCLGYVETSTIVARSHEQAGLDFAKMNRANFVEFMDAHDPLFFTRMFVSAILGEVRHRAAPVVVTGMRTRSGVDRLEAALPTHPSRLLAVVAPEVERQRRFLEREGYRLIDEEWRRHEYEELAHLVDTADARVINDGSLEAFLADGLSIGCRLLDDMLIVHSTS